MRIRYCFVLLLFPSALLAQESLTHFGNMNLHQGAQLGIYGNFINLAPLTQNEGLVGFYGSDSQLVSGTNPITLYDAEIAATFDVSFLVATSLKNNLNFISGDLISNRLNDLAMVSFQANSFVVGASDFSKIDGTVEAEIIDEFEFPVGDKIQLRSLNFKTTDSNAKIRCTYFRDNPASSFRFGILDSESKSRQLHAIGAQEFWRLEGESPGIIRISWNSRSELQNLNSSVETIEIIGWHKEKRSWEPIGISSRSGDLIAGFAISEPFIPNEFEVLTFGGRRVPDKFYTLDNYYISPNNDGKNDFLEIEELLDAPENTLKIYDRNGILVFSANNYVREFEGFANTQNRVFDRNAGLPEGVYFYIAHMLESGSVFQGYLYLDR